jgi:hypothetical protein
MEQITLYTLIVLTLSNPSASEIAALENTQLYDVSQRIAGLTYEQCLQQSNKIYQMKIENNEDFIVICQQNEKQ